MITNLQQCNIMKDARFLSLQYCPIIRFYKINDHCPVAAHLAYINPLIAMYITFNIDTC